MKPLIEAYHLICPFEASQLRLYPSDCARIERGLPTSQKEQG